MSRFLLMQSIGAAADDRFGEWMNLATPVHRRYAERHGADYQFCRDAFDAPTPHWNRMPRFLDAFEHGYEKVVWFDADVLVLEPERDIFTETLDVPLQMMRDPGSGEGWPWRGDMSWDWYNDGVLVACNTPEAIDCFEWVWARRHDPPRSYHVSGIYNMNWMLDWVYDHPDAVVELDERWNSWRWAGRPKPGTFIAGWHGRSNAVGLSEMRRERHRRYDLEGRPL